MSSTSTPPVNVSLGIGLGSDPLSSHSGSSYTPQVSVANGGVMSSSTAIPNTLGTDNLLAGKDAPNGTPNGVVGPDGVSDALLGNNRGHVYEYKGRKVEIRDVWKDNLEEEMKIIRRVVVDFPYVAMDTEFPGVVARPIGSYQSSDDYAYQTLRCNVDLLKLIQLGIAFADEDGNFADGCPCWQFHFKFSLTDDMYAQDSIDLLVRSGINFKLHEEMGIDVLDFGELLISSGLILEPDVRWISFHGSYDFGYLLKLLTCTPLPADETDFFELLKTYFPRLYDVKHIMTKVEGGSFKGGLNKLGEDLGVQRIGPMHQAGSDSLFTASIFFKTVQKHYNNNMNDEGIVGIIHGLGAEGDSSRNGNGTTFRR